MSLTPEQIAEGLELAAQQDTELPIAPPVQATPTEPVIEKPVSVAVPIGPRDVHLMEFASGLERLWFMQHQREAFRDGKRRGFKVHGSFDSYHGRKYK